MCFPTQGWELSEHRSRLVAAPLQCVQVPADPGARMLPSASLVGPLVIVPIIIRVRSNCLPPRLLLVGLLVILSIMKCPRSLSPRPALACLRVGPLVIAREIIGLWSPSLRPSYNLVLYKVRSSPCCASGCYSRFWGEGWSGEEGARGGWGSVASHSAPSVPPHHGGAAGPQPTVLALGELVMPSPRWVSARGCVALGFTPTGNNTALIWGFACPMEGVPQGLLLSQSRQERAGRWQPAPAGKTVALSWEGGMKNPA